MSVKATAVIRKGSYNDERTGNRIFYAELSLRNEAGREYGIPRRLSGYQEAGNLLQREAGVAYEQLQDWSPLYEKGQEIRLLLTLENEEAIRNLGFDPRRADEDASTD